MMIAISLNSPAMVQLLLKSENLDLHAKTRDGGKSFIHLCVGPHDEVSKQVPVESEKSSTLKIHGTKSTSQI